MLKFTEKSQKNAEIHEKIAKNAEIHSKRPFYTFSRRFYVFYGNASFTEHILCFNFTFDPEC